MDKGNATDLTGGIGMIVERPYVFDEDLGRIVKDMLKEGSTQLGVRDKTFTKLSKNHPESNWSREPSRLSRLYRLCQ